MPIRWFHSSARFHNLWINNEDRPHLDVVGRKWHRVGDLIFGTRPVLFGDRLVSPGQNTDPLFAHTLEVQRPSSNVVYPSIVPTERRG